MQEEAERTKLSPLAEQVSEQALILVRSTRKYGKLVGVVLI